MRHAYTRATAMPPDLVEAQARANSACEKVWREARRKSDFAMVRPHLEEVVRLTREAAAALAPALDLSPYDALMDGYQRGMRAADVAPVFADYEALPAPGAAAGRGAPGTQPGPDAAARSVPDRGAGGAVPNACPNVSGSISTTRGWTVRRIRSPAARTTDVRITTRYDEADFTQAVLAVVHETGHALYERGLPASEARQPVGEAAGMAAHESQSLIVEMQACRSDAFLAFARPVAARGVRRRCGAVSAGQSRAAVAAHRARLHPRRCR